ncbi:MAG TPA: membrane protein insertase YidC [Ignavibacteriaceae bacterium]|nr:membrane protein insertase YidC [Ignavibacteriaceae bacterium]
MDRNTTIAFVLIGAILIIWLYLNSPTPPPQQKGNKADTTHVEQQKKIAEPKPEKTTPPITKTEKPVEQDSASYGKYFAYDENKGNLITIENDLVKMELSTRGANIKKYYLKKYNNWYSAGTSKDTAADFYETHVQLINYSRGNALNIAFVSSDGKAINTKNLAFTSDKQKAYYKISGEDSLTFTFTYRIDNKKEIKKIFTFHGDKYSIDTRIQMVGMNNLISNNAYDLVWGNGIRFVEENSADEATSANASVYYGGEQVIVDDPKDGEKIQKEFNGRVDWVAVRNKYFAAIIAPKNPGEMDGAFVEGQSEKLPPDGMREYYNTRINVPFRNTAFEEHDFTVYVGPVDYDILKAYGKNLEAVVDFGSFFGLKFLVRPIAEYVLLPLFNFLHNFIPNYGFVIVVFSLIIKLVLYPLTKQSFQSMKKMQMLQPKIAELKEKYPDDKEKVSKETMKMYSTYGVNPAGGCLPMVLQMPIFIALWGLFKTAIELRQQPFILWIHDLSSPDIILNLGVKLPLFGISEISGLAILMGITTFFQQKMSVKDPNQKALVYVMPVMLTLMFMSFPSGLNLYYFLFNLFSIVQQYYINHKDDGAELVPVKNPKKKKGFMSKMMEAAEQQQKAQQKGKKKK